MIKMRALLVQQGLLAAIDEATLQTIKQADAAKAADIEAKAHTSVLISLGDEVLLEVPSDSQALSFLVLLICKLTLTMPSIFSILKQLKNNI